MRLPASERSANTRRGRAVEPSPASPSSASSRTSTLPFCRRSTYVSQYWPATRTDSTSTAAAKTATMSMNGYVRRRARDAPVVRGNRPQHLIEVFAVTQERLSEQSLARCTELPQRGIAASIRDGRARFQPMYADVLEHELQRRERGRVKQPCAPEFPADREAPLRRSELGFELAHLNDADCVIETIG